MSVKVDTSSSILHSLGITRLWGREEIFTLIDHTNGTALIYDFERRHVYSRCIVRAVDYRNRTMTEMRSRTLRFRIKSTFAPSPGEDEGITFTGGGFTASVIAKDNTYRIISALPDFPLPSGKKGLKSEIEFYIDPEKASFNQICRKNRSTEALHSSISPSLRGTLIIGGEKKRIIEEDITARRVWKTTSFPMKRNSYSSYCYGRADTEPFSFTLSIAERKCFLLVKNTLTERSNIRVERTGEKSYFFTDDGDTRINLTVYAVTKEKSGPFRQNRTLKYGLFTGVIASFSIPESFGSIEL